MDHPSRAALTGSRRCKAFELLLSSRPLTVTVFPTVASLDAEHAYMFASRGPNSTFNTYVATGPLKVLYFDGFSASKGNPGAQDLQKLVAFGSVKGPNSDERQPRFEDGIIAEGLCKWGAAHGIQGFVREEATFELIWVSLSHVYLRSERNTAYANPLESVVRFQPRCEVGAFSKYNPPR